jgi:hypothetical protein
MVYAALLVVVVPAVCQVYWLGTERISPSLCSFTCLGDHTRVYVTKAIMLNRVWSQYAVQPAATRLAEQHHDR